MLFSPSAKHVPFFTKVAKSPAEKKRVHTVVSSPCRAARWSCCHCTGSSSRRVHWPTALKRTGQPKIEQSPRTGQPKFEDRTTGSKTTRTDLRQQVEECLASLFSNPFSLYWTESTIRLPVDSYAFSLYTGGSLEPARAQFYF